MRKLFLTAALAVMCAAILTGCGSSSDKKSITVTPVDLTNPDTLVGTYSVSLFYTDIPVASITITNDCAAAVTNGFAPVGQPCDPTKNVSLFGQATITKDAAGNYVLRSKVQMGGGVFNIIPDTFKPFVAPNQYNYTLYKPVSPGTIELGSQTINKTGSPEAPVVKGTNGRNAVALSPDNDATYFYQALGGITLLVDMVKSQPMPGIPVKVVLNKILDTPWPLNPNEAYASPVITNFVPDVGYSE